MMGSLGMVGEADLWEVRGSGREKVPLSLHTFPLQAPGK